MSDYICIGVFALIVALLVWSFVPILIVKRFKTTSLKDNADIEDNYRKTMGQAIGAVALIVTFAWTFYKDRESIDLSRDQFQAQAKQSKAQAEQFTEQQKQARDQFINQQFIGAAGLLKEESVSTRIAGLYGIEQIASTKQPADAANPYLIPAIHTAIGFVGKTTTPGPPMKPIGADKQSAITILAHLNENHQLDVDLRNANLARADFRRSGTKAFTLSDFEGAVLYGADLSGLDLTGAKFGGSYMSYLEARELNEFPPQDKFENTRKQFAVYLDGATLVQANFDYVSMSGASLTEACLASASFVWTNLSRVSFQSAHMAGGSPECDPAGNKNEKAYFPHAVLVGTNFDGVDIEGVSFFAANLSGTDFSNANNVDKADFQNACADAKPNFPPSFTLALPPCPR
jgi:uncharacterized protein YjbI with pentapeptide repeats